MAPITKSALTLVFALSAGSGLAHAQTGNGLRLSGSCPASVIAGQPFTLPLVAGGGNGTYSFAIITGPPWVSLSASSGVQVNGNFSLALLGTPPTTGTFPLEVAVFDTIRDSPASFNCNLVVTAPPLSLTGNCPATAFAPGASVSVALTASGGNNDYRFSIAGPSWLSVSNTGVVTGTVPAGVAGRISFSVTLTDTAQDQPATFSCTITVINTPLTLSGSCPTTPLTAGSSFSLALAASGGSGTYRFSISGPSWLSVSNTGVVSGTSPAGVSGSVPFTVTLTDTAGDQPASFSCTITINTPLSLTGSCPTAPLTAGSPVSIALMASGGSGTYRFSISGPSWLSVSNTGVVSGTSPAGVGGSVPFTVTLTDSAGDQPASFSCTITINTPLSLTGSCPTAPLTAGSSVSIALVASGGSGTYSFAISGPSWLSVSSTGVVSGTPPAGVSGRIPFTVTLTDTAGGQPVTFNCTINIASPLSLTGACPAAAIAPGSAFSLALTASGGNGAYRFSISGPPWLSVSSTGLVSGTVPLGISGAFPFSVTVADTAGNPVAIFSCSITIGAQRVSITSGCPAGSVVQGTSYSQILTAVGGDGTFTFSIISGNLPAGLTLSGNLISGTALPPAARSSFIIQVSSAGATDQLACAIDVAPAPLAITSGCPGDGVQGRAFSPFTLMATGGLGLSSFSFSIINGSLPPGLALVNGVISGTPTGPPGTSVFTLQATSGALTATAGPCSLIIAPPLSKPLQLTGTCPAGVTAGAPFTISLAASGGTPPYAYTLTSGDSFFNVTANGSVGMVTGVAPSSGTFPFTVTLIDAAKSTPATFSCQLVAGNAVKIQAACPGPIAQNQTLTLPLMATGGTPPYRWTLTGPSWLSLTSNTGESSSLSGTPPDQGQFPFTVTLADSAGLIDTFSCTVIVTAPLKPPLVVTPSAACPASPIDFGSSFSLSFGASGGMGPYSWSLTGPPWLSLQSKTGTNTSVSGTANVEGPAAFTVSLDDSVGTTTATFTCNLVVGPAPIPAFSLVLSQQPATIFDPLPITASLSAAAPVALEGDLQLTFTSNAFGTTDNPQVKFLDPAATANGRLLHFRIEPGSVSVPLTSVQQGTVAGVIRVELVGLKDGTRDVLPTPHPFLVVTVPKLAPVMTSVTIANQTANGFDILISGYSTTRDIATAELTFTAAPGASLQAQSTFSVPTSTLFSGFYSSSNSQAAGSMFEGLRIPVTVTGDKTAIGSVSVKLTNSVGSSDVVSKSP